MKFSHVAAATAAVGMFAVPAVMYAEEAEIDETEDLEDVSDETEEDLLNDDEVSLALYAPQVNEETDAQSIFDELANTVSEQEEAQKQAESAKEELDQAQQEYEDVMAENQSAIQQVKNEQEELAAKAHERADDLEDQVQDTQKAYDEARVNLQQAQSDLEEAQLKADAVNSELTEARDELETLQNDSSYDVAALQQQADEMQAAYEKAQEDLSIKTQEAQNKTKELEEVQTQLEQAEGVLNDAAAEYEASAEQYELLQQEIQELQEAYQAAMQTEPASEEEIQQAFDAWQDAKQNYEEAKARCEEQKEVVKKAQAEYDDAIQANDAKQQEIQALSEEAETARQAMEAAEKKTQEAYAAIGQAQTALDMANAELISQQLLADQYEEDLAQAQLNVQNAQAAMDEAKKNLEKSQTSQNDLASLQAAVDAAYAQKALGALGFYQSLAQNPDVSEEVRQDAARAAAILQDTTGATQNGSGNVNVAFATHIGAENDATSLENMRVALGYIEECNALRAQEGVDPTTGSKLQPLGVNSTLMAISQKQTNYAVYSDWHSHAYGTIKENLAWGYKDPYAGWYTKEKDNYLTNNGEQTGHYLAIVSTDIVATGAAYNSERNQFDSQYNKQAGQVFSYDWSGYNTGILSLAEYTALFDVYCQEVDENIASAEAALAAAQNKSAASPYSKSSEQKAYENAVENYNAALDALNALKSQPAVNLEAARAKVESAQAQLDAANAAYEEASKDYADAAAVYERKADEVNEISTNNEEAVRMAAAKAMLETEEEKQQSFENEVQTALSDMEEAEDAYEWISMDPSELAMSLESSILEKEELADAAYALMQENLNTQSEAQQAYQEISDAFEQIQSAASQADAAYQEAKEACEKALEQNTAAQADLTAALAQEEASAKLETSITELESALVQAQLIVDTKKDELETASIRADQLEQLLAQQHKKAENMRDLANEISYIDENTDFVISDEIHADAMDIAQEAQKIQQAVVEVKEAGDAAKKEAKEKVDAAQASYDKSLADIEQADNTIADLNTQLDSYLTGIPVKAEKKTAEKKPSLKKAEKAEHVHGPARRPVRRETPPPFHGAVPTKTAETVDTGVESHAAAYALSGAAAFMIAGDLIDTKRRSAKKAR